MENENDNNDGNDEDEMLADNDDDAPTTGSNSIYERDSNGKSKGKKSKSNKSMKSSSKVDDGYGVSRGIDFQNVSFVVNFDFPQTAAAYTHRIGRTARAGASGTSLSFVLQGSESEQSLLQQVQQQQTPLDPVHDDNILSSINTVGSAQSSAGVGGEGNDGTDMTSNDLQRGAIVQPSYLHVSDSLLFILALVEYNVIDEMIYIIHLLYIISFSTD